MTDKQANTPQSATEQDDTRGHRSLQSQMNLLDRWYVYTHDKPFGQKADGTPWTTPDCPSCNNH